MDSFVPDRARKEALSAKEASSAACTRLNTAIAQVPDKVLYNRKNRATETLYVGNLDFKATEEDLSEALSHLSDSIVVAKVTIPCVNGKSRYGFVELSWAQSANVNIADLIIMKSVWIQVDSRPIYLRELRDKGNKQ